MKSSRRLRYLRTHLQGCLPDVDVLDVGEAEELRREGAGELVVADVDLVEEVEGAEGLGEGAGEAVGVEVEDGEV